MPSLNELCVKLIDTLSSCRTNVTMDKVLLGLCEKDTYLTGLHPVFFLVSWLKFKQKSYAIVKDDSKTEAAFLFKLMKKTQNKQSIEHVWGLFTLTCLKEITIYHFRHILLCIPCHFSVQQFLHDENKLFSKWRKNAKKEASIKTRWRITCQKSFFLFVSPLSLFQRLTTLYLSITAPSLSLFHFISLSLPSHILFHPLLPSHSASVFSRILSTFFFPSLCFCRQRCCMLICWRRRRSARCVGFNHPEGWLGGFWKLVCWD